MAVADMSPSLYISARNPTNMWFIISLYYPGWGGVVVVVGGGGGGGGGGGVGGGGWGGGGEVVGVRLKYI